MGFVVISRQSDWQLRLLMVLHTLFARRLRLGNPWNFKAPALLGVAYLAMLTWHFKWDEGLQAFGWSLCTIVGIAGFGYLTNDLGDRKADLKAGKDNLVAALPTSQIAALFVLFLGLAITPWVLFFPVNAWTASLLAAEFLLFLLYIAPPFRLKERGLLGIFTDALYAHVNPAILATLTFVALSGLKTEPHMPFLLCLGGWQLSLGMRNILLHQLKDADHDRQSGLRTWVVAVGEERAHRALNAVFLPLEVCAWLTFLSAMASGASAFPLIGWALYMTVKVTFQKGPLDTRAWLYRYLDDYYVPVFPLTVLAHLVVLDSRWLLLAAVHILLFKTMFSPLKRRLGKLLHLNP